MIGKYSASPFLPLPGAGIWTSASAIYVPAQGTMVDVVSQAYSTTRTAVRGIGGGGLGFSFSGGTSVRFPSNPRNGPTGGLTILAYLECSSLSNYNAICAKQTTTTTNTPYEFRLGSASTDSKLLLLRANAGGYRAYQSNSGANRITAGNKRQFVGVTVADGTLTTTPNFYGWDGTNQNSVVSDIGSPTGSGTGTGSVTDTTSDVYIGTRYDGVTPFSGIIYSVVIFPYALTTDQIYRCWLDMLSWKQVAPLSPPARFGVTAAGGSFLPAWAFGSNASQIGAGTNVA